MRAPGPGCTVTVTPWEVCGLPARERFLELDGRRVRFIDEGEGAPLLFIHGIGGSMTNWAPCVERFRDGRRVLALDLPGFGGSDLFDIDYSLEDFSSIVRAFLDDRGVERVVAVGNSMGGLVTLHLASAHPELLEGIVLVDTAGAHRFPALLRRAFRRLRPETLKRAILFSITFPARHRLFYRLTGVYQDNSFTRALIEEGASMDRRPGLDGYLEAYLRSARNVLDADYRPLLPGIYLPTLIIWGREDLGIPERVGRYLNTRIPGSFFVSVPGAAHMPQLDRPDLFNRALERFLAGLKEGDRFSEFSNVREV